MLVCQMPSVRVICMQTSRLLFRLILVLATILYVRCFRCWDHPLLYKALPEAQQLLSRQVGRVFQGDPETQKRYRVNLSLANSPMEVGDLVFTIGEKMASHKNVDPSIYLINNYIFLNTIQLMNISLTYSFPYGDSFIGHSWLLAEYFI